MPSSSVWERSTQSWPSKGEGGVILPLGRGGGDVARGVACERRRRGHPTLGPGWGSLRPVAVGVLEDVYNASSGLQAGGVLGAGGYVVGLAGTVGVLRAVDGQVEGSGDDHAPLGTVGVGRHLELLFGAEKDRLAVGARDHAPFEALEGGIDLREALDPIRVRVHRCSFPGRSRHLRHRRGPPLYWAAHAVSETYGGAMERLAGKRTIV